MCGGPGMSDPRAGGDATDSSQTALDNKAALLHSMPAHSSPRSRDYNPYNYSDSISPFNKSALKEAMFDDDADQFPDGMFCVPMLLRPVFWLTGNPWSKRNIYAFLVT